MTEKVEAWLVGEFAHELVGNTGSIADELHELNGLIRAYLQSQAKVFGMTEAIAAATEVGSVETLKALVENMQAARKQLERDIEP